MFKMIKKILVCQNSKSTDVGDEAITWHPKLYDGSAHLTHTHSHVPKNMKSGLVSGSEGTKEAICTQLAFSIPPMTHFLLLGFISQVSHNFKKREGKLLRIKVQTQDHSLDIWHLNSNTHPLTLILLGGIIWSIEGSSCCPSLGYGQCISAAVIKLHDQKQF